jgi:histone demethylase JARID1
MCFSSFCWHVEDHHFYSINYMHWGAPKIWYGVPGYAADKLEAAMKKHLPDLFYEQPDLLQKLVTQLSPSFLKQEGVPVYRIVQQPGDFVITFPNAYHSGFNAGFNVAEAVNVAPVDWLPHGQAAVERYRELGRKTSVSHDKLLLGAARVAVRMWWHSQQTEKAPLARGLAGGLEPGLVCAWQAYCGEGGMLANALKARVNMEHVRRESLKSMIGATLSMKQMDSSYDATDERECEACKYDLHLSAVGCQCCPDKFACLLHGHLLCTCPWSMKTLFYRYPFEQLSLLLAAVEGRPGAVATWAKQNGLMLSLSPSNPRGLVKHSQAISGNGVLQNARTSTSSVVAETHPQMDSRTKEMAAHHINVPDKVYMVPKLEPGIAIQPFLYPPRSLAPCDQITPPGNNPVLQDSMAVPSNSQKVVLLRSGYARAAARRNALEQAGSSKSSLSRPPGGEQGSSPQPAPSASESQRLALPSPDVILLSDDEEEMISCKLNEAADSSFSAHEFQCSLPSRVPECAMDNRLGSQAYQAESKVDLGSNWCTSSSNDLSTRPAFGRAKPTSGDPSPGSVEAVSASGNIYPGATAMTVGSLFKERALNSPSSASNLLSSRPDVQKASPAPTTEVVTVVQRGANILPRLARVREKRDVELIDVGRLVVREGWCTRHAIYPAGFKSRLYFTSVENIFKTCLYVSEIIDRGVGKRPLFQVTHATKREPYLHESIDGCWHAIQNDINETIISLRSQNSNLQLPPLLPPPNGVEMFGLATISIIEAVESLDPLHQCQEYWISKQQTLPNRGAETAEAETRRAGLDRLKVELKEEEPPRAPQTRAPPMRFVNTTSNSRIPVNNNICSTNKAFPVRSETPTVKQGVLLPSSSSPDTYSTMQGLFQRATPTELRVLYRLFTTEARGAEWGFAFRALKEEVQKKILG